MAARDGMSRGASAGLGLVLVVVLVGCVVLSIALYRDAFTPTTDVSLVTDRSGLLLERGAEVELHGVVVGRVTAVDTDGTSARISLAVDTGAADTIPADVTASIAPLTLLGRKVVVLDPPDVRSSGHLQDGQTLRAGAVGTEVGDLLRSLVRVIDQVDPEKVTTTVSALSSALDGSGEKVARLITQLNQYLGQFNPLIPTLGDDARSGSLFARQLAASAPDLLATVGNLSTTATTITQEQGALSAFILSFTRLGTSGRSLFDAAGVPLQKSVASLRAPLRTLADFAPIYPCFLAGLAQMNGYLERAVGGSARPGINVVGTLLMGNPPYSSRRDLPRVGLPGVAPSCYPTTGAPPHIAFDDGSHAYSPIRGPEDFIGNPLADLLFGGR